MAFFGQTFSMKPARLPDNVQYVKDIEAQYIDRTTGRSSFEKEHCPWGESSDDAEGVYDADHPIDPARYEVVITVRKQAYTLPAPVESYLANGGNIDAFDDAGNSLVMRLMSQGKHQMVDCLLDKGAWPNPRRPNKPMSAYLLAVTQGNMELARKIKNLEVKAQSACVTPVAQVAHEVLDKKSE